MLLRRYSCSALLYGSQRFSEGSKRSRDLPEYKVHERAGVWCREAMQQRLRPAMRMHDLLQVLHAI